MYGSWFSLVGVKRDRKSISLDHKKIYINKVGQVKDHWGIEGIRDQYKIVLGNYWFPYYGSVYDFKNGNGPTEYDVLACLEVYDTNRHDINAFRIFCEDFGYDINEDETPYSEYMNVKQIYEDVLEQSDILKHMFTEQELEWLACIN